LRASATLTSGHFPTARFLVDRLPKGDTTSTCTVKVLVRAPTTTKKPGSSVSRTMYWPEAAGGSLSSTSLESLVGCAFIICSCGGSG
jgi:hypothetical protein